MDRVTSHPACPRGAGWGQGGGPGCGRPAPPPRGQLVPSTQNVLTVLAALAGEALRTKQSGARGQSHLRSLGVSLGPAPLGSWGVTALGSFPSVPGHWPCGSPARGPAAGSLSNRCDGTGDLRAPPAQATLPRIRAGAALGVGGRGDSSGGLCPFLGELTLWGPQESGTVGGGAAQGGDPGLAAGGAGGTRVGSASAPWVWGGRHPAAPVPPSPPSPSSSHWEEG